MLHSFPMQLVATILIPHHFNIFMIILVRMSGYAVLFVITGCATKCQQCRYDSSQPKAQQKCAGTTVDCLSGYCYSASYTQSDGIKVVERDCDNRKFCPDAAETCRKETQIFGLKSCSGTCCTTDNCNDSGTSSVLAAKFSVCFLAILGYFLA